MLVKLLLTIVMIDDDNSIVEKYGFYSYDSFASCYAYFNQAAEYGKERAGFLRDTLKYKFEYLKLECI